MNSLDIISQADVDQVVSRQGRFWEGLTTTHEKRTTVEIRIYEYRQSDAVVPALNGTGYLPYLFYYVLKSFKRYLEPKKHFSSIQIANQWIRTMIIYTAHLSRLPGRIKLCSSSLIAKLCL